MTEAEKRLKEFSENLKSSGVEEVTFPGFCDDSLFIKDIETVLNMLEEAREYINFLAIGTHGIKEELLDKCVCGFVKFNETIWGKELLETLGEEE